MLGCRHLDKEEKVRRQKQKVQSYLKQKKSSSSLVTQWGTRGQDTTENLRIVESEIQKLSIEDDNGKTSSKTRTTF